ncbi:MAG: beta-ketoacyl-[acyl-carrier-protein] synthase family protein [Desulfobacterota bacterium]|nr:beta-ketoacyl-[acyl-carrier-protein] synthase family protein [Thermodesulfobacteriota bacterium]
MKRRVVITGLGAITPLGNNLAQTWNGVINGRSGIGQITIFDASRFPVRIAGEVKDFIPETNNLPPDLSMFAGRSVLLGLAAARMAVADAGLDLDRENPRLIGVSIGGDEEYQEFGMMPILYDMRYAYRAFVHGMPAYCELLHHATPTAKLWAFRKKTDIGSKAIALTFHIEGPSETSHTACSSSGHALGKAKRLIEQGECDIMIAGGHCSMISEFSIAGFHLLGTLSTRNDEPQRACRPFDLNRDGFVMGEGAGIVVLEELEHARRRGARIYAELAGYGASSNAYRLTDTPPDGRGGDIAMRRALEDGCLDPADISYINAHGTGTLLNDRSETRSIKNVFKDRAPAIPISSSKSMLGHLVCSSSAVELIITVLAVVHDIIPPTINYETPDPDCDLDYVPNTAREQRVMAALSNSFAFGGQNATLAVKKFTG